MFKTVIFAFTIIVELLNICLVFTKLMKKYWQLEFVLDTFTQCNLFWQFAQVKKRVPFTGRAMFNCTELCTNVVIFFPAAICLTNRLERNNV